MVKVLAVVVLLAVAQAVPACEGGKPKIIIGYVQEKRFIAREPVPWLIVIESIEYPAPQDFWNRVGVGDLVKYDGLTWTLIRKATS